MKVLNQACSQVVPGNSICHKSVFRIQKVQFYELMMHANQNQKETH